MPFFRGAQIAAQRYYRQQDQCDGYLQSESTVSDIFKNSTPTNRDIAVRNQRHTNPQLPPYLCVMSLQP